MRKEKITLAQEQSEDYLLRIISIIRTMENISFVDKKTRLHDSEIRMLSEIFAAQSEGKRLISTQLADRLNITRSAISQMVNKLEKMGVVNRIPDEVDKKIAYIELSNLAHEKYLEASKKVADFFIASLPENMVSHWDFRVERKANTPRDTSASACAAACAFCSARSSTARSYWMVYGSSLLASDANEFP